MKLNPALILDQLTTVGACHRLVVAYSGGLDSTVLLHIMACLRDRGELPRQQVRAVHVNHGLNPAADAWQVRCRRTCKQLNVELDCLAVRIEAVAGKSQEQLARDARYRIFNSLLQAGDCLLLAHHKDDEMEHLLLRLTRGSGPGGLSGMPRRRQLERATLLRPFLDVQREVLRQYAAEHDLTWIEDDSNTDITLDRNFWRHRILPLVAERFPGYRDSWTKSMSLIGEADTLAAELADADLSTLVTDDARVILVEPILKLSELRQRNVLRYWMRSLGFSPPGWHLMHRLSREILTSDKATARLDCTNGSVQRFGNHLALLGQDWEFDCGSEKSSWKPAVSPRFALSGNGELCALPSACSRIDKNTRRAGQKTPQRLRADPGALTVRYCQPGEKFHLAGRPVRPVRKLLQESALPVWLRNRQPLLYAEQQLVCIPGVGVCENWLAASDQDGLEITWITPDVLFRQA